MLRGTDAFINILEVCMSNVLRGAMASLAVVAGLFSTQAGATVVIGGTRVVYPSQEKEVTVSLTNEGKLPGLIQIWVDDGDEQSTADAAKAPFIVTPPIFRLDGGKGQAARLAYTNDPLPADKESLFWLNVLEVPPKPQNKEEAQEQRNMLQFAFRTRIKLFFRPARLTGTSEQASENLTWKLLPSKSSKGLALQVFNPTPYYVNFAGVGVDTNGQTVGDNGGGMVAPGGSTTFELKDIKHRPPGEIKAGFTVITEHGALNKKQAPITQ